MERLNWSPQVISGLWTIVLAICLIILFIGLVLAIIFLVDGRFSFEAKLNLTGLHFKGEIDKTQANPKINCLGREIQGRSKEIDKTQSRPEINP